MLLPIKLNLVDSHYNLLEHSAMKVTALFIENQNDRHNPITMFM